MEHDHVGISVTDLDGLTSWYCEVLGMSLEYRVCPPGTGLTGVMLHHPSGFRLELLYMVGAAPGLAPQTPVEAAGTRGYGHLCLRVRDVAAAYDALVQRGAMARRAPAPSPARPGSLVAFVADPDGNLIELLDRAVDVPGS